MLEKKYTSKEINLNKGLEPKEQSVPSLDVSVNEQEKVSIMLQEMIGKGLITGVMGEIPNEINPCVVVWARKDPKYQFNIFSALSKKISRKPLKIFVDDVCSTVVDGKSDAEQALLNQKYNDFFKDKTSKIIFSSSLYESLNFNSLQKVWELSKEISFGTFLSCLPLDKRLNFDTLSISELVHLLLQLIIFREAEKQSNIIFTGNFSQAIISIHRKISKKPMTAIIIPKLKTNPEVDEFIKEVQGINSTDQE